MENMPRLMYPRPCKRMREDAEKYYGLSLLPLFCSEI